MKRTLLSVLSILFLFSQQSMAQLPGVTKIKKALPRVDIGLKVGADFHQLNGKDWKSNYNLGVLGGAFVGVHKNNVGVQVEGLINSVSFESAAVFSPGTSSSAPTVDVVSLNIPVLFQYRLIPRLWVQVGPQFSTVLSAKNNTWDMKKTFTSNDFSAVLGLEAKLPMRFSVGGRYVLGLTDVNNTGIPGAATWKNRSAQVFVCYRLI